MDIWHTLQDRYPKVDLEGRRCGDLHPLGSETNSTYHGAGYVFVGVANVSLTLEVKSAAVCLARESWTCGPQVQQASVC